MSRDGADPAGRAFVPGAAENQIALLHAIIDAVSAGPDVGPLAAVARLITGATTTDVCFVHVLDDAERSLSLAGATPPFDFPAPRRSPPTPLLRSGYVSCRPTGAFDAIPGRAPTSIDRPSVGARGPLTTT